jgi:TatD DNase family protein
VGLFDVHAHLTHPRMVEDQDAVLERARAAGISTIVSNGLNPSDNDAVLALAAREPMVRPALGFYPVDTVLLRMRADGVEYPREGDEHSAEEGVAYLRQNVERAFAVGEIGLDGHWVPERYWPEQEAVFRALVSLALEAGKPIIIHTRKREARALEILDELGATRVDWHCFGGKVKLARRIAERGHYLSIPANAPRSESFTRMLETLPRERGALAGMER